LGSFGYVEGGAQAVLDGFLEEGCTIMVLVLTFAFACPPPGDRRPARNGVDYQRYERTDAGCVPPALLRGFSPDVQEIERGMGVIPATLLAMSGRVRGNHPRDSFAAVGPMADRLISGQTPLDVYAPLRALAEHQGAVVLMGVGLDKMTLLHLAEQQAGRNLFRRWAYGSDMQIIEVEEGGCSSGFVQLQDVLGPVLTTTRVGDSHWRVFPAEMTLTVASEAIRYNPSITHCGNPACLECRDAIAGGPE
jgi:aminoglycoside 3-N-acetyltransferase